MKRLNSAYTKNKEDGFTLLELVTSVGVVLIMVMVGWLSFNALTKNAKQAAVQKAADEVYNMAYAALISGDKTPEEVVTEYNFSQGKKKDIIAIMKRLKPTDERIQVTAIMGDYEAVRSTPSTSHKGNGDDGENTTKPIIPGENPDWTTFTYRCDEQESGYLPLVNISEGTKVYKWEKNDRMGTFEEIEYRAPNAEEIALGDKFIRDAAREEIYRTQVYNELGDWDKVVEKIGDWGPENVNPADYTVDKVIRNVGYVPYMEAGVEYSVRYDGDVETFTSPGANNMNKGDSGLSKCLRSVDNMGNSTNLQNIVYIGTPSLVNVPDSIPSTVVTMRGAFENTTEFNDPSVTKWDTSNVKTMRSMFNNAESFNQDISGWDVSNLINAELMFERSSSFNQNLNNWDTSQLTYAWGMFRLSNFNNGCTENDTSCPLTFRTDNLKKVPKMFESSQFNQNISTSTDKNGVTYWNMNNVEDVESMFKDNKVFNNGQSAGEHTEPLNWDTSSLTNASFMFNNATVFNQDISSWSMNNVTTVRDMFNGATAFNNGDTALSTNKPMNWTFKSRITLYQTFFNAKSFNQDLKKWDLTDAEISSKYNTLKGSGISCTNVPSVLYTQGHCTA